MVREISLHDRFYYYLSCAIWTTPLSVIYVRVKENANTTIYLNVWENNTVLYWNILERFSNENFVIFLISQSQNFEMYIFCVPTAFLFLLRVD